MFIDRLTNITKVQNILKTSLRSHGDAKGPVLPQLCQCGEFKGLGSQQSCGGFGLAVRIDREKGTEE
ncbi:unnamed protein product [Fusarium graminearum]|nr:unnamed protein product [Fusarium graminearum]